MSLTNHPLSIQEQIDLLIENHTPLSVISKIFHYHEKELEEYIKLSKLKLYLKKPDFIFGEIEEPYDLCCPITNILFVNPVTAGDGQIYEKTAIEQWIQEKGSSPINFQLKLSITNIIPNVLHKNKVLEFRDQRLKKILFYVDIMIGEKSACEILDQVLTTAEEDCRILKREAELYKTLKKYNYIRKMDMYRGSFTKDLEALFKSLLRFKKYPQAIEIGDQLAYRYEHEKNIPPGKLEGILKDLITISIDDTEKQRKYKSVLYGLYMKAGDWDGLQGMVVEHLGLELDDEMMRETVKASMTELMFVFKLKFYLLKEKILKELTDKLEKKEL